MHPRWDSNPRLRREVRRAIHCATRTNHPTVGNNKLSFIYIFVYITANWKELDRSLTQCHCARIHKMRCKNNSSLGGLEPPTFRLTVWRASRLRHRDFDDLRAASRICEFFIWFNNTGLLFKSIRTRNVYTGASFILSTCDLLQVVANEGEFCFVYDRCR